VGRVGDPDVKAEPKRTVNGRSITITGYYNDGSGEDDLPGLYYVFDDTPDKTHWMTLNAARVRIEMETSNESSKRSNDEAHPQSPRNVAGEGE
jgi:hypothetical protein